jgi:RNA polymerase sigma factor (sigma-70 family)
VSEGPGRHWTQIYDRLKHDVHDVDAYTALFEAVAVWARRDIANVSDRDDAVAETCAAALLGLDKAYGASTFDGFVRGHYFNARRRVSQRVGWSAMPLNGIDVPAPQTEDVSPDELSLLQDCLAQLSARMRRAVELRYFQGASAQDIAHDLEVSIANARQLISRGLAALQRCARAAWPRGREWPL